MKIRYREEYGYDLPYDIAMKLRSYRWWVDRTPKDIVYVQAFLESCVIADADGGWKIYKQAKESYYGTSDTDYNEDIRKVKQELGYQPSFYEIICLALKNQPEIAEKLLIQCGIEEEPITFEFDFC